MIDNIQKVNITTQNIEKEKFEINTLYTRISYCEIKRKNKKYHTVGTVPKSDRNIVERGSSSCLGIGTSRKGGGVELVLSHKLIRFKSQPPCFFIRDCQHLQSQ